MKTGKLYVRTPFKKECCNVLIIYEGFGYCLIEALDFTHLEGSHRCLNPGERAWVPNRAIRLGQAISLMEDEHLPELN